MEKPSRVDELFNTFQYESCASLVETIRSHLCSEKGGIKFYISLLDDIITSNDANGLKYGDILEFQGPNGSGKRHLLYFIAAITLLPQNYNFNGKEIFIGGLNEGIVLLDCSEKWKTLRLEEIMCEKVKKMFKHAQENNILDKNSNTVEIYETIKEMVKKSLSCLYIFRPQNSVSLVATLQYLSQYFKTFSINLRIRYVFIDSVSAFYLHDRSLDSSTEEKTNIIYKRITQLLKEFCFKWCALAICTSWVLKIPASFNPHTTDIRYFTVSDDSLQIYYHHLPFSYTAQVSHRICFLRKAIAQFPSCTDLKDLLIYSNQRDKTLQLGLHLAVLQRSLNIDKLNLNEKLIKHTKVLLKQYNDLKGEISVEINPNSIESLNKKILNLQPIIDCFKNYERSLTMIRELEQLKHESQDHEMIKLTEEEIEKETVLFKAFYNKLKNFFIPKHPQAGLSCILEIHSGVGGDEATLFASELLRMYQKYAITKNWKYEILSMNKNEGNEGISEAIVQIDGQGVFGKLKNETGVHRVQRIPNTESKGRTHTSTVIVIVLPKIDENHDFDKINMKEVKIEVMRSRGAGGQHVNKTESAVRMTHIPTGISVSMQDSRSQHQNRAKALIVLKSRVAAFKNEKDMEYQRSQRRSQVPSATRPDKIRTYNFTQNRITDHRCGFSLYDLDGCMNGGNGLDLLFNELELWTEQMEFEANIDNK
ncbi:hypothetical protein PCK1_003055 [Pneumocystis canis]|nr:hypothetical protein PCK1_003055 [Pneumocystis canis]